MYRGDGGRAPQRQIPVPHRGTGFAGPQVGSPPREVANYTERSEVRSREASITEEFADRL